LVISRALYDRPISRYFIHLFLPVPYFTETSDGLRDETNSTIDTSAYFGPRGGSRFEGNPLLSSGLGDDDAMRPCAPAATHPKVYAKQYATRAAACRGYHIGSLQELPHTLLWSRGAPSGRLLRPAVVAYGDGYSTPSLPRGTNLSTRSIFYWSKRRFQDSLAFTHTQNCRNAVGLYVHTCI
jgi:hypothetical protein